MTKWGLSRNERMALDHSFIHSFVPATLPVLSAEPGPSTAGAPGPLGSSRAA